MSLIQSPPSASITATSRSTRPGSCAERRSRVGAIASASAPVSPARSANSTNSAAPACETNPSPSAVTSTVCKRAVGFTNWVSSWVEHRDVSNPDSHDPGGHHPHAATPLPADRGWEAPDHLIGTGTQLDLDRFIPEDIARAIERESGKRLKIAPDGYRVDANSLRTTRRITEDSAALLDSLLSGDS